MKMKNVTGYAVLVFLSLPSLLYAHTGYGGGGFVSGLMHPVLGFDHLLAMVSVGILSAQMGGQAIWKVPATFVMVMMIGGILGISGVGIPVSEYGIAASVLFLGVALFAERKLPVAFAMIFVGFFAVFHGYAHGVEMPEIARPLYYSLGFTAGTALIHIFGVLIGYFATKSRTGSNLLRFAGAGIAGIGLYILMVA